MTYRPMLDDNSSNYIFTLYDRRGTVCRRVLLDDPSTVVATERLRVNWRHRIEQQHQQAKWQAPVLFDDKYGNGGVGAKSYVVRRW